MILNFNSLGFTTSLILFAVSSTNARFSSERATKIMLLCDTKQTFSNIFFEYLQFKFYEMANTIKIKRKINRRFFQTAQILETKIIQIPFVTNFVKSVRRLKIIM